MRRVAGLALLLAMCCGARAQDGARYVSDELAVVMRDAPRAEGASRGVLVSGTKVDMLERDANSGYARVRTPDNREGWVLERYLKTEPIARDKLLRVEKELTAAQAELKKLRDDHARLLQDFSRISGGQPVASRELVDETERLRARLERNDAEVAELRTRYDTQRAAQRTLVIGGALVAAGFLLAVLLRWLWPKRRWGDL